MRKQTPSLLFLCLLWLPSMALSSPLLRIVPQGENVPMDQRIRLEFDRPMVALGQAEAKEVPVQISPPVQGQWRWTDPQTLSFRPNPEEKLKPATRYTVDVEKGLTALDGTAVPATKNNSFTTTRPEITHAFFQRWANAATPVFQIHANLPLTRESVEKSVVFRSGDFLWTVQAHAAGDTPKASVATSWIIKPPILPGNQEAELMVKAGLISPEGPEPGIEKRGIRTFATFPQPSFLGIRYTSLDGNSIFVPSHTPDASEPKIFPAADPQSHTELVFSTPVRLSDAAAHVRFTPPLPGNQKPWDGFYDYDPSRTLHTQNAEYGISLPVNPNPKSQYTISVPDSLPDTFGRTLKKNSQVIFQTDHLKPSFSLPGNTAVLEKGLPSDIPLFLTNIDSFRIRGMAMDGVGLYPVDTGKRETGLLADKPALLGAGIRTILPESGIVSGEIITEPEVRTWEGASRFLAIVSPWQVVVKLGHFNSLVWVTDLRTGIPVPGVRIHIREGREKDLEIHEKMVSSAITNSEGVALLPGTAELDPEQNIAGRGDYREDKPLWFLEASLEKDRILFPLDWRFSLHLWQVSDPPVFSNSRAAYGHLKAWGLTSQGIYRTGETMEYKIYIRNQDITGLIEPPLSGWTLRILDPRDQEIHARTDLDLSKFGSLHGAFPIPEDGAVGRYRFQLSHEKSPADLYPLSVMVTDFSTAPFRTQADISALRAKPGDTLDLKASAALHAGGAYTDAPARIRSHIHARPFTPPHPLLRNFFFDSNNGKPSIPEHTLTDITRTLDSHGTASIRQEIPETDMAYGELSLETSVSDERGKSVSATTRIPFEGRDLLVGIRSLEWMQQKGKTAEFQVVVCNPEGSIIPDIPISFRAERQEVSVIRARGAGDAYTPRYTTQWKERASTRLTSGQTPVDAVFTPNSPGRWRVSVTIHDSQGRSHTTRIPVWVSGPGSVTWENPEDQRIEMIPEKDSYRVGETARILVKNPFPGAMALISVERYGILRHEVRPLKNAAEIIEIPIGPAALPGCYVAISLLSPRVAGSQAPETGPDMGKPAFRSGYLYLSVTAPQKKIPVSVTMEKEHYKPGEEVRGSLQIPADLAMDTEIAMVVLDSAIFDLLPGGRRNFDPHTGLYTSVSSIDVETYTLLTRLLGMQKLDAKGATPAGDGGGLRLRENFRGVAYWNPEMLPDENGRVTFSFPAPDNLTGWEVLAMAVSPRERMGTGQQLFKVNRPTEIRPIMPNFLRKEDRLQAGFSILNRTDEQRNIHIRAELHNDGRLLTQRHFDASFAPWQRSSFFLPMDADHTGTLRMEIIAKDALDGDALAHSLDIRDSLLLETQAVSGKADNTHTGIPIRIPGNARTDVGGIGIRLSPSLLSAVEAPLLFLKDYPYTCWEQQLSKAMGAALYLSMMDYLPDELQWEEAETLISDILSQAGRFQSENGAMGYFPSAGGGENPFLSAFTALMFKRLSEFGFTPDPEVSRRLETYLDTLLRRNVSGTPVLDRSSRMMALLALAPDADATLFDRLMPQPQQDGLFATALFLEAGARQGLAYHKLAPVVDALMARTHRTPKGMAAQDDESLAHPWLMGSHNRTQAAVLMAMIRLARLPDAPPELHSYVSLLVNELMEGQGDEARWQGTQENLFAAMAAAEYALTYESATVDLHAEVQDPSGLYGGVHFRDIRDTAVRITRPMHPDDPGREQTLHIQRQGKGPLYYTAALTFASHGPLPPADSGLHVNLTAISINDTPANTTEFKNLSRGDRVRLAYDITSTQNLHFIMAEIPLPAGFEAVNPHLATSETDMDRSVLPEGIRHGSPWPFYHQEFRHEAVRFFAEEMPAGTWRLTFTVQAIAEGRFHMPAAHGEALYRPEIWGRDKERIIKIGPRIP
ncbi:MG2 domain-containing protein [Desulfobotulus sp. H1]|uniref:MG2 domain-containing protein n=1 Tax=Desulfobotulus pelophilus TaxID=2823377 RepID=A0ABT3N5Y7_9BACT|nr:Ig-like domain-containing alpha-2-macroglobulin family protein [Desulfobotulus pelophilus]MCW7752878.1 MG2 domain-containing protein [Desulfobotulus pelophilus]